MNPNVILTLGAIAIVGVYSTKVKPREMLQVNVRHASTKRRLAFDSDSENSSSRRFSDSELESEESSPNSDDSEPERKRTCLRLPMNDLSNYLNDGDAEALTDWQTWSYAYYEEYLREIARCEINSFEKYFISAKVKPAKDCNGGECHMTKPYDWPYWTALPDDMQWEPNDALYGKVQVLFLKKYIMCDAKRVLCAIFDRGVFKSDGLHHFRSELKLGYVKVKNLIFEEGQLERLNRMDEVRYRLPSSPQEVPTETKEFYNAFVKDLKSRFHNLRELESSALPLLKTLVENK